MKTCLGDIKAAVTQPLVELFNVQQLYVKIQTAKIDFVMNNGVERERVVGTG